MFADSPISLWEEDFSAVKALLDSFPEDEDLIERLASDEDLVRSCIGLVQILDVNQATLDLFLAQSKDELLGSLTKILADESVDAFRDELAALLSGETEYECEIIQKRLDGEKIHGLMRFSLVEGYLSTWEKVIISIVDITERKLIEEKLRFGSFNDRINGVIQPGVFG